MPWQAIRNVKYRSRYYETENRVPVPSVFLGHIYEYIGANCDVEVEWLRGLFGYWRTKYEKDNHTHQEISPGVMKKRSKPYITLTFTLKWSVPVSPCPSGSWDSCSICKTNAVTQVGVSLKASLGTPRGRRVHRANCVKKRNKNTWLGIIGREPNQG